MEYTDIGILHIIEVVDFHRDPSHDVWPILNLALVSFDPKSEPNIDSEMEPEDGPLYSFKWDTDNRASQNVTIRTTDTQNCGSRAIEKNSSSATVLEVIFENNCSSALWTQPFIHFLMTMVHPRASIGDAGTRGAARAREQPRLHRLILKFFFEFVTSLLTLQGFPQKNSPSTSLVPIAIEELQLQLQSELHCYSYSVT